MKEFRFNAKAANWKEITGFIFQVNTFLPSMNTVVIQMPNDRWQR